MSSDEVSVSVPPEWISMQLELGKQVSYVDAFDMTSVKHLAGVDISFDPTSDSRACAYLCILDAETLEVVYEDYEIVEMTSPYISGFLAFREVQHYCKLIDKLKQTNPEYLASCVVLVDGFGVLHERKCGSASHLGVITDLPTIGVAKQLMLVDGLDEHCVKSRFEQDTSLLRVELVGKSGTVHGVAWRSAVKRPIYISVGHKLSLDSAVAIVSRTCRYRIPEPIRVADIRSKLHFDDPNKVKSSSKRQRGNAAKKVAAGSLHQHEDDLHAEVEQD